MPNNQPDDDVVLNDFNETISSNSGELQLPPDTYVMLVQSSFEQCQPDLDALDSAVHHDDYNNISTYAHKLKGVYANLRLRDLAKPLGLIEELAQKNGDIAAIRLQYTALNDAWIKAKSLFQ